MDDDTAIPAFGAGNPNPLDCGALEKLGGRTYDVVPAILSLVRGDLSGTHNLDAATLLELELRAQLITTRNRLK